MQIFLITFGVCAKLLYPDDTIQHAGVFFHRGYPAHLGRCLPSDTRDHYHMHNMAKNVSAVTAACLGVSRRIWDEVGGFDETRPIDYNDVDFNLKVRKLGYLVLYDPRIVLRHYESASRGHTNMDKRPIHFVIDQGKIMQRYPEYFSEGDPYLNPSIETRDYYNLRL